MLDQEFKYYLDHQEELLKLYPNKYLVIKDETVVGAFESEAEAYLDSSKKFQPGSFLIQLCEKGENSYTQVYHSRVTFA